MELLEYQILARNTNLMQGHTAYHLLGLLSEIGELFDYITTDSYTPINDEFQQVINQAQKLGKRAGILKKLLRDKGNTIVYFIAGTDEDYVSELGDVLWYLASASDALEIGLDEIAEKNIQKLADRKARNVIQGSGDKR